MSEALSTVTHQATPASASNNPTVVNAARRSSTRYAERGVSLPASIAAVDPSGCYPNRAAPTTGGMRFSLDHSTWA
jgi:hypothetical protein